MYFDLLLDFLQENKIVECSVKRQFGKILLDGKFMSQQALDIALEEQKYTKELLGQLLIRKGALKEKDIKLPLLLQERLGSLSAAVKTAAGDRQQIGELLVSSGHITPKQLDRAISEQKQTGQKLGEVFIRLGILTEKHLSALLDYQLLQEFSIGFSLRLGELLVAINQLSREQLDLALLKQNDSHKKIGEILVDEGYLRPSSIKRGVRLQKVLVNSVLAAIISLGASIDSNASQFAKPGVQTIMRNALHELGEYSCLSSKEEKLFRLVNEYRQAHGLPPIENSRSLNKVARVHAIDLSENAPATGRDRRGKPCSLHSWSDIGYWKSVCYTEDNMYANSMWNKPREITNFMYTGDGYENAYFTSGKEADPARVLEAWKASPRHNAVLLQSGAWKGTSIMAFGIGIHKNYAVMWVGSATDPLGPMQPCTIKLAKTTR